MPDAVSKSALACMYCGWDTIKHITAPIAADRQVGLDLQRAAPRVSFFQISRSLCMIG